jgi:hypothetical protein
MDYATLFQTIQAYCENDFPDTVVNTPNGGSSGNPPQPIQTVSSTSFLTKVQIDTFIEQAEYRIFNSVQIPDLRKNVTGNCSWDPQNGGNKYLSVPSDWLANFSLSVIDATGVQHLLLNKDVEYIREAFPDPNYEAMPTHYAIFDQNSYILGPTPDAAYLMELHYFYYPISIVSTSVTNTTWLSTKFPQALLYGALLEAYTFMKGEQDVSSNYIARYNEALAMLKQLGEGKNRQDMYRTEQARYPVK